MRTVGCIGCPRCGKDQVGGSIRCSGARYAEKCIDGLRWCYYALVLKQGVSLAWCRVGSSTREGWCARMRCGRGRPLRGFPGILLVCWTRLDLSAMVSIVGRIGIWQDQPMPVVTATPGKHGAWWRMAPFARHKRATEDLAVLPSTASRQVMAVAVEHRPLYVLMAAIHNFQYVVFNRRRPASAHVLYARTHYLRQNTSCGSWPVLGQ